MNYKKENGGFIVEINKKAIKITSVKKGFFELSWGVESKAYHLASYLLEKGSEDILFAWVAFVFETNSVILQGSEVSDLQRVVNLVGVMRKDLLEPVTLAAMDIVNNAPDLQPNETSEGEDAANLGFVQKVHDTPKFSRAQRRRISREFKKKLNNKK